MIDLPEWLPPSAAVDIVMLMDGVKPGVRLRIGHRRQETRRWARRHGLYASIDQDGFAALSLSGSMARRIIDLDRRPGRHTLALGYLLGYPRCCSLAAARVGDEGIDGWQERLSVRRFHGRFRAIDPRGYRDGDALISHVPCSCHCSASLSLALRTSKC